MGSELVCVLGKTDPVNQEPPHPAEFPKYLRCYRCLLETKELGCLLGSDICLASPGSSCMTLFIRNSKLPSVCLGPRTESTFPSPNSQHCPIADALSFRAFPDPPPPPPFSAHSSVSPSAGAGLERPATSSGLLHRVCFVLLHP